MRLEDKKRLMADLLDIAEQTKQFKPPYIPGRYLQDLANSAPAELVTTPEPTRPSTPTKAPIQPRRTAPPRIS